MLTKAPRKGPTVPPEATIGGYFEWSTDEAPVAQRLDSYVGHLCERLMNVTASSTERDDFHARLTTAQLGPLHASTMSRSQAGFYRTRRHVPRSKEQAYHLAVGLCRWKF